MNQDHKQFHHLDKSRIRASFDAAAEHYDDAAVLQREVGNRILERLELIRLKPETILDVGAGTGVFSRALGKRFNKARVISLDLAPRMLVLDHCRLLRLGRRLPTGGGPGLGRAFGRRFLRLPGRHCTTPLVGACHRRSR